MNDDEVEKLYARYEARLGAATTKMLGQAALQLYSGDVSIFLPIPPENQFDLVAHLGADPFVEHTLSAVSCEIYHRYGMFLALLTTALATANYCQFRPSNKRQWREPTTDESRTPLKRQCKKRNPKKVPAGRARSAAHKAKQEKLRIELWATKEALLKNTEHVPASAPMTILHP